MYSTSQLVEASGVTYRRIDYWCRRGVITPSIVGSEGQGISREWSELDLERMVAIGRVANDLLELGFGDVPTEIVGRLWDELGVDKVAEILADTVEICVRRGLEPV